MLLVGWIIIWTYNYIFIHIYIHTMLDYDSLKFIDGEYRSRIEMDWIGLHRIESGGTSHWIIYHRHITVARQFGQHHSSSPNQAEMNSATLDIRAKKCFFNKYPDSRLRCFGSLIPLQFCQTPKIEAFSEEQFTKNGSCMNDIFF